MSENSTNKTKSKKLIIDIVKIIASLLVGIFGGSLIQNAYVQSQVANVNGDGNTININSVDDLVKNYNKISEENETLKDQNKEYFERSEERRVGKECM